MTDLLGVTMIGGYALLAVLAVRAVLPPPARHPVAAYARRAHARRRR
ncbi:hypothetical protein [Pseudonocardia sp. KRD291]|nr:hypothetical protein [Pseudonocardia sp. KRD291]MBW0106117.1 hypothetical protein [Pseudonocardia sp. KRD291]